MKKAKIDITKYPQVIDLITEISEQKEINDKNMYKLFKKYPKSQGKLFSKVEVLQSYRNLVKKGTLEFTKEQSKKLEKNLKMKNVRTLSGVTPVTVLTKPYPCPGKCIFCPNDVRMPKSYLSDEPGAQRAALNKFDPYLQTFNRLIAFKNIGHSTDKVELLILGGTWSFYPEKYQIWFVKRCFDAMNDFQNYKSSEMVQPQIEMPYEDSELQEIKGDEMEKTYNRVITQATLNIDKSGETATWEELYKSHKTNERAQTKCVGLIIETRPDEITKEEVLRLRKLGTTRVQLGIQSLNDKVLKLNKRGHDVAKTREAFLLLRQAGFKIMAHWMPNLYGSSPKKDINDFKKVFGDTSFRPDELKIYPCSLIESAELMKYYKDGRWKPYSHEELLYVLENTIPSVARYCRLARVIRDIPSTDIVVGNKKTNFREIANKKIKQEKMSQKDIRAREVKNKEIDLNSLKLKKTRYLTKGSKEVFIEWVTPNDEIAGFLRLSLPTQPSFLKELYDCAIIREVHVYGISTKVGSNPEDRTQHKGLGKKLIFEAKKEAKKAGFSKLSVISSIGTREYYEKFGFALKDLYQHVELS